MVGSSCSAVEVRNGKGLARTRCAEEKGEQRNQFRRGEADIQGRKKGRTKFEEDSYRRYFPLSVATRMPGGLRTDKEEMLILILPLGHFRCTLGRVLGEEWKGLRLTKTSVARCKVNLLPRLVEATSNNILQPCLFSYESQRN